MTERLQRIEASDLFKLSFVGTPQLAPSGKRGVFVVTRTLESENAYTSALWLMEQRGVRQLTNLAGTPRGRDNNPRWSPDGKSIAFLSDRTEKKQVWLLDLDGGEARQLTQVNQGIQDFRWGPGSTIFFTAREDEPESGLPKGATARRITHLDLWLLDTSTGELRNMTGGQGRVYDMAWAPDGETLYYLGDERAPYPGGYPQLWRVTVANGSRERLAADFPYLMGGGVGTDARFDGGTTGLVATGSHLYFAALVGGNSHLYRLDLASGVVSHAWGDGPMVINSYDVVDDTIVVSRAAPDTPGDLWLGCISGDLTRVTSFNDALFENKYIGWPEPLEFERQDGTKLEGWIIKPIDFDECEKHPLVFEIHGGPHSTYGNIYFHEFQVLAGLGFGVLYTNPRGSLGYGEEFARAVVGDWCGVDADDLEFMARDALRQLPWADSARFGVTGGSQGGYFTNWLVSHTDLFRAAVTQRSMSNLYSKFGVSDIGWFGDRAGMGGHDLWGDEGFIMERSPIRYAPNVHTPILIIHSDQDFRCPLEQAEQWYVALKRLGVTTEFLLFHGENHELSRSGKPANRLARLNAITSWFQRYMP